MRREAIIYGAGGLIAGVILTVLLGLAGMASMMGGMGRMMGMCGNQGSIESPEANHTTSRRDQVLKQ